MKQAVHHGSALRWPFYFWLLGWLSCLWLATANVWPQTRPVLRNARRAYLAGNFVLIPHNPRWHALAWPKQLAALADHQLYAPPQEALTGSAALLRWAQGFDFAETDGVLLALDPLLGNAQAQAVKTWLTALRAQRPNLPIYASVSAAHTPQAFELVEANLLDFLLVAPAAPELSNQIAARQWQKRVALGDTVESAAALLQTRLLNRRFGFAPRVAAIFSTTPNAVLQQTIRAQINLLGGVEAAPGQSADLYLFVHTAQTAPNVTSALANALEKAATEGARCAVLDLSHAAASQEALLNNLRQRKLLDRVTAYAAAATPATDSQAVTRALTQTTAWLLSIKFLRDNLERVRRTERTQIALLLGSYLRDWAYPLYVRAPLEKFLRTQPKPATAMLTDTEQAENFALGELRPYAEKLFAEQFKRNIHAVLLAAGERAEFELTLLQRLQIRLNALTPADLIEPDIRVITHLAHLGNFMPQPAAPRAVWDFTNGRNLDERLSNRFEAVDWRVFKTDAEAVEVTVKLNQSGQPANAANIEGYAIRSRRNGQTRRIEITAPSASGAFYAFGKLEQLGANGQLAQDVNLTEAPDYAQRGLVERVADAPWTPRERLEWLRCLGRVRMNRYVYAAQFDPWRRDRWRAPYPNHELERFDELARVARENFVSLVYALNPGATLDYSSEEDFAALTAKLKALASTGINDFVLAFDDAPTQLQRDAERARFKTLAAAQAQFVRRTDEWLKAACPTCRLSVVPANPLDAAEQSAYLQELGANLPASVTLVWLGSESFLPEYTRTRVQEMTKLTGRRPLVWGSFASNAKGGLFLGAKRAEATALAQEALGWLCIPPNAVYAARLPLATAAEYAWESRSYAPERALENALNLLYDERSRAGVRLWARAFGGANPNPGAHSNIPTPSLTAEQLTTLQTALAAIGATRDAGLLRGELAAVGSWQLALGSGKQ
ncbi:MAG: DUF4127 family protein [Acidobacteria bacterium]|nr:DUF4127 family protein [Acidobacteriota bacterium]